MLELKKIDKYEALAIKRYMDRKKAKAEVSA